MGRYPDHYVGHYSNLAHILKVKGFLVYPMEMVAHGFVENEANYVVDVVAVKDEKIWAFEYKTKTDPVKRAIKQASNYLKCFDFVVVAAENLNDLTNHRETFRKLGAGTWYIDGLDVLELDAPILQTPTIPQYPCWHYGRCYQECVSYRDVMYERFLHNTGLKKAWMKPKPVPIIKGRQLTFSEVCV